MKDLMEMLADKEDMPESQKDSKMKVLMELKEIISAMMDSDSEPSMEQVTVAAPDSESLEKGLGTAQEMLGMMPKKKDDDEDEEEDMY